MSCEALRILMEEEIEKAREEARSEVRMACAIEMLRDGKTEEEIIKYSKLTMEELDDLKKQLKIDEKYEVQTMDRSMSKDEQAITEYIREHESQIYHGGFIPPFDLRGYAQYIREHKLSAEDITPEILKKFSK